MEEEKKTPWYLYYTPEKSCYTFYKENIDTLKRMYRKDPETFESNRFVKLINKYKFDERRQYYYNYIIINRMRWKDLKHFLWLSTLVNTKPRERIMLI